MANMKRIEWTVRLLLLLLAIGLDQTSSLIVKPTKLWKFLNENDEPIEQRFRENIDVFGIGNVKCLRYCIESKAPIDHEPKFADFIWKLDNDNEMKPVKEDIESELIKDDTIKFEDYGNTRNRCTFSIVMGCEFGNNIGDTEEKFIKSLQPDSNVVAEDSIDVDSPALNFLRERLVDKTTMTNGDEISFHVQPNQAEVSVLVFGNVSRIELKMPVLSNGGPSPAAEAAAATPQGHRRHIVATDNTLYQVSPAAANARLILATKRMPDGFTTGVRLNVANPPPGGWRIVARGSDDDYVRRAYYRLIVAQAVVPEFYGAKEDGFISSEIVDTQNSLKESGISSRQIKLLDDDDDTKLAENPRFSPRTLTEVTELQHQKSSIRFPNDDKPIANITTRMDNDFDSNNNIESRILNRNYIDLADSSNNPLNEELPMRKHLIVELNPRTELSANPGSYHRLLFDITNNYIIKIGYNLLPASNPFSIYAFPRFVEISPGQTLSVPIDVAVPPNVADIVNKVTLRVEGIEIAEKSVNFYVRQTTYSNGRNYDDKRPDINYYFNNNCNGRASGEKCLKSYWSVDIVVQDDDSGLKSVTSSPRGIYATTSYTSGTSSPVKFFYSNNCCNRVVEVTAFDVHGNTYSRRIDVDEWTNLTTGEILAIVFITLFIVLLIIMIALLTVYCIKHRKSHDMPYSQRYGSRSSPQ